MRGVARWYLVGSLALLGLFGCSRSGWFEDREPWRREAEVACLKSGAVKEGPGIAQLRPINGPGMCGADYPLKVSALGGGTALGFADEPRPPGSVPGYSPIQYSPERVERAPLAPPPSAYRADPYAAAAPLYEPPPRYEPPREAPPRYELQGTQTPAAPPPPMQLHPAEADAPENDADDLDDAVTPPQRGPYIPARPTQPAEAPPALGPQRAPMLAATGTAVTPAATLACPMVSAVERWIADSVQPAAQRWFGQPVVEVHQISAYSCRGMNGNPRARISEHAFGNALDVAAFTLADGRKVTVQNGWRGAPDERGFLHDVHAAACQQFSTVLGPGSNALHYNHLHLDLMRRGSGRVVCNPAAIPGDAIAGRRGGGWISGAAESTALATALGFAPERAPILQAFERLPLAVPGED